MKPSMLISRKKALASQLAEFEQQKKQHVAAIENKQALINKPKGKGGNSAPPPEIKHSQYDSALLYMAHAHVQRCTLLTLVLYTVQHSHLTYSCLL
jgi:hypothetical protein